MSGRSGREGRRLFHEYASEADSDGEVRYTYLLKLLQSADPDDKENACLAIASAAQDSEPTRQVTRPSNATYL